MPSPQRRAIRWLYSVSPTGAASRRQRADLVELDADLKVRRVMRAGAWID